MDLNELMIFVYVVQTGSIRAAAEQLGIPKSTVSRKILALEERLETRLMQRTSRKMSLTDVGKLYFDYAARIVTDIQEAERAVTDQRKTPRGLLRITTPVNIAFLGAAFSEYIKLYPEVRLELSANTRVVDLIAEGFDAGIRVGNLEDSSLVSKLLVHLDWHLVATTQYLRQHGHPLSPADLKKHDCLLFGHRSSISLTSKMGIETIDLNPRLLGTNLDVLKTAMSKDLGIALLPSIMCTDGFRTGELERVLPAWTTQSTPVQIVYPSRRQLSPKVRSFIDHMEQFIATMKPV